MGRKGQRTGGGGCEAKEARWDGGVLGHYDLYLPLAMLALALCSPTISRASCPVEADPVEQALATVRDCMARSPAPWADVWNGEYVDTIREAIISHKDAPQLEARLQVLRDGSPPYWDTLEKSHDRSVFDVDRAQIRWYVEYLMGSQFPGPEQIQLLRSQYRDLVEYAMHSLLAQFPFLDPNQVQKAKAEFLRECSRSIDAPLQPIFLLPYSVGQVDQIRERWHDLRYARVDLWRQLTSVGASSGANPDMTLSEVPLHYLLAQRSLSQLRLHLWTMGFPAPEYYLRAVAERMVARQRGLQSIFEGENRERRLPEAVLRTEYVTFLLAAVLETARSRDESSPIQARGESSPEARQSTPEQTDVHGPK
jgi:hypothetical protein